MLTAIEKKALKEFQREISKKLPKEVELVRLYGSKARGDAGKHSDIDILMVVKSLTKKVRYAVYEIEDEIIEKYDLPLSIFLMSKKHYQKELSLPTLFIQFVQKQGIDLADL